MKSIAILIMLAFMGGSISQAAIGNTLKCKDRVVKKHRRVHKRNRVVKRVVIVQPVPIKRVKVVTVIR